MKTMKLTKYKLGELLDVTRGASLSGEYFATQGDYMRLTCGNFDYQNNCFKLNTSKDNLYYTGNFNQEYLMEKDDIITPLTEQAIGLLGSCFHILLHPRLILWSVRYSSLNTCYFLASFCNTMSYNSFCWLSICKITDFVRWLLGIL